MFYITTLPMHLRRPNLFPKLPLPLRETLDAYSLELKNLTMILLEQIAKALQMKAEEMRELLEDGIQSMRINYYPPCPQPELEPGDLEGFGQAFVLSEDQKLDWADMFYITTLPMHLRRPNLFPKLPLPLRETLDAYSLELKNLTMILLEQIAKALQMKAEEMRELLEDGIQSMRINYYPPCPQPELVVGLTPHSDFVVLTILLQVNEVEGLEIRKQGMWIPVKPLPNAFIVNVGDIMEIVTNGAYRSVEHRATVNSVKERLSVATFYFPNFEREIGPAPSLISPQNPAVFRRVGMEKFFKGYFTRELSDKSTLDNVRIEDGEGSSSRSN
uniref:Fe2OG dioxygenase domain-containing protein n=1 Tax=Nelumbo nucifera TaxID=4432 RepID=A0A822YZH3_NELNU|nr:TPA_asm: hypothetical protein HUJ06_008284 [Nelumbo nucifera]